MILNDRIGDWIQTYTGKSFYPLDVRVEDICIEDIAHALSMSCRYNGHCRKFYSVAEHCCYVSVQVSNPAYAFEALMHDASEAYICDVPRPIKPMLQGYKELESNTQKIIHKKFEIVSTPESEKEIKRVDTAILADEASQLMGDTTFWTLPEPVLGITIECWPQAKASELFLERFMELTG